MYGDWAQWKRRYEGLLGQEKILFGVGCRVCIPQGYKGCTSCLAALPEWQGRHVDERWSHIEVAEAGQRIAGL